MKQIWIAADDRLRSGWRFLIAVLVVLFSYYAAAYLSVLISHDLLGFLSANGPLVCVLLLIGFCVLSRAADHVEEPAAYLGFGRRKRDWFSGCATGALLVSATVALIALFGDYAIASPAKFSWRACLTIAWVLLWGGLAEELAFRSYPFLRLREAFSGLVSRDPEAGFGAWAASLCTGLLFGAIHLNNPHATMWGFVDTVLIGIFFGLVMARTKSLWLLWGIHFGWNFTLGLIFGLPVSGLRIFSVFQQGVVSGPIRLTGGDYGIEASLPAGAIILVAIVGAEWALRPRTLPPRTASDLSSSP